MWNQKKRKIQMNLLTKQKETHRHRKQTYEFISFSLEKALIKVLTKDQDEKKINYMGLSELMRMSIIFVTFCLN